VCETYQPGSSECRAGALQGHGVLVGDRRAWPARAGGGHKIIRCEISLDGGKSWRLADIQRFAPPNAHGKHWAWVFYSLPVSMGAPPPALAGPGCRHWPCLANTAVSLALHAGLCECPGVPGHSASWPGAQRAQSWSALRCS